jgi:transposase
LFLIGFGFGTAGIRVVRLPPLVIARLYKSRWQVELFFKWIKQNLRIKHFFGHSDNAVKTQIWISIAVYVLVAIVKKELKLEMSLSQILQILSINVFSKEPLVQLLTKVESQELECDMPNQLVFNY